MNLVSKLARPLVVLVLSLMALAPASAMAQTAWRPSFDAGAPVYIDPAMASNPNFPVALPGLSDKLKTAGDSHNVKFLVVVVQQTTQSGSGNLAGAYLDELLLRWQNSSGFPSDNYVLMVWMRSSTNPSEGWVAVNAGSNLKVYGLTKSTLDSATGPVLPALKKYMPHDPKGCFQGIAANVNKAIDDYELAQQEASDRSNFLKRLPIYIGVVLLAGGVAVFFVLRSRSNSDLRQKADAILQDWTTKLDSANTLYMKLRRGYLGFVQDQQDWKSKFTGQTRTSYMEALANFADFSARLSKANKRLAEAKNLFDAGSYKAVNAKLENETIEVTGQDIPLEDATLFGGLVEKTDYTPSALLDSMASLFETTNRTLAGIMKTLRESLSAGEELDQLQTQMGEVRTRLGEQGFTRFKGEFDSIAQAEAAVRENFKSDPVSTKDPMLALLKRAQALKKAMEG